MWKPSGYYNQFVLSSPAILTGSESARGLFDLPSVRIAVIHGNSFKDRELFESTFRGKDICFIKRSWQGEPDFDGLQDTVKKLESFRPDTVIAVGGGSVIDGCKLCRILLEFPYYDPAVTRIDGGMLRTRFIAVPTTVGSGAEVSSAAVYTDHNKHNKQMVVLHELLPDAIVYDTRYVNDATDRLLCASGLDAMAHILEGYVSKVPNSFAEMMAENAFRLLSGELSALSEGSNVNYEHLQYAGYLGGIVQNHCIVGAAHAIAHQLGAHGYSHGEAVAILLPAVITVNSSDHATEERYEHIAANAGLKGVSGLTELINDILMFSGIEDRRDQLKELLISLTDNDEFIDNVIGDRGGKGNPVEINSDYLKRIVEIL